MINRFLAIVIILVLGLLFGSSHAVEECRRSGRHCERTSQCCGILECRRNLCLLPKSKPPTVRPRTRVPTFRPTRPKPTRRPTPRPTKDCLGVGAGCKTNDQCCSDKCLGEPKSCRPPSKDCKRYGRACELDDDCCGDLYCDDKTKFCAHPKMFSPTQKPRTQSPTFAPTRPKPTRRPTAKPTKDCLAVGAFCKTNDQCCSDRCFGTGRPVCKPPK